MNDLTDAERERRKFGTDVPNEPTDEFVVQAFADGAGRLWPDSRDPGWHATFRRWLAAHDTARLAPIEALAAEWTSATCQTDGAPCSWHRVAAECAAELRAALADPQPEDRR